MVSEALHVIEQLVYVLRPAGGAPAPLPGDLAPLVPQLFSALQAKLRCVGVARYDKQQSRANEHHAPKSPQ
jgi:hypothetical protein